MLVKLNQALVNFSLGEMTQDLQGVALLAQALQGKKRAKRAGTRLA